MHPQVLCRVRLFAPSWTVSCQIPLSMGFSRQEYWSGLPFPSPGDLPDPGIKPISPALAGRFFTTKPPGSPESARGLLKTQIAIVFTHGVSGPHLSRSEEGQRIWIAKKDRGVGGDVDTAHPWTTY